MATMTSQLLSRVTLPRFFKVCQRFDDSHIEPETIRAKVFQLLSHEKFSSRLRPGMRVAISAGSRGISHLVPLLRSLAEFCKSRGAEPFIVPAMGSHGGAMAEGQIAILAAYGVTEESIGCPIRSTMEVERIGTTSDGREVYLDRYAHEADGIIVFNRVKYHSCFSGPYQSGIMKMMAIGLANQYGAERCHDEGFGRMHENIVAFGRTVLREAKVLFAVPVVENAYDQTAEIRAWLPEEIDEQEPELLAVAGRLMPRIAYESCDVFVVDEIGKNMSGDGMDPHVTGRFPTPYASGGIHAQYLCALDLTPETHGNGMGMGMADVTTRRLFNKLNLDEIYPNSITSCELATAKIPCIMENDREAMQLCLRVCVGMNRNNPRIIRIPNTAHVNTILLSEAFYEDAKARDDLEILSKPDFLPFDADGNLMDLEPRIRV